MLVGDIREFVAITGAGGKASDLRLKRLMVTLRQAGLTSPQIVELSGGMLSDSIVRQYTVGWGGVKKNLVKQMNVLMGPLRELVQSGKSIGDVVSYVRVKSSVEAKGSSLEGIAELDGYLATIGLRRGEVGRVVNLERQLEAKNLNVDMVDAQMEFDERFSREGYTEPVRRRLVELSKRHGGVDLVTDLVVKCIEAFDIAQELLKLKAEHKDELRQLDEVKIRVARENKTADMYEEQNRNINALFMSNWTFASLILAPEVMKQVDSVGKQIELQTHLSRFTWFKLTDEDHRLVERRKAYQDPVEFAAIMRELKDAFKRFSPELNDGLVNFAALLNEKVPGLSLGDFGWLLLRAPDASERERRHAKYLVDLEQKIRNYEPTANRNMLSAEASMLKLSIGRYEIMLDRLKHRYPDAEQQKRFDKVLQSVTNTIPPGVNIRDYWGFVHLAIHNLSLSSMNSERLTEQEKTLISSVDQTADLLEKYHLQDLAKRHKVDYELINNCDREAKNRILGRLLQFTDPPYGLVEEIAVKLDFSPKLVENFLFYVEQDPKALDDIKGLGLGDYSLPVWVVKLPE